MKLFARLKSTISYSYVHVDAGTLVTRDRASVLITAIFSSACFCTERMVLEWTCSKVRKIFMNIVLPVDEPVYIKQEKWIFKKKTSKASWYVWESILDIRIQKIGRENRSLLRIPTKDLKRRPFGLFSSRVKTTPPPRPSTGSIQNTIRGRSNFALGWIIQGYLRHIERFKVDSGVRIIRDQNYSELTENRHNLRLIAKSRFSSKSTRKDQSQFQNWSQSRAHSGVKLMNKANNLRR